MKHSPITRQRSEWTGGDTFEPVAGYPVRRYERNVHDGTLRVLVGSEPTGLHLSISHSRHTQAGAIQVRYPTWDEIVQARDTFLPADKDFGMILPKAGEFVSLHATTFHLNEIRP